MYAYVRDSNTWTDPLGLFDEIVLTEGIAYRKGSGSIDNLTPRQEINPITGQKRITNDLDSGLSTNVNKPKGKSQAIDIAKLKGTGLEAIQDAEDHITIRPKNDPDKLKLKEWAETKGTDIEHKFSKDLQNACN